MCNSVSLEVRTAVVLGENVLDVLDSGKFFDVHNGLLKVWSDYIKVYTNRSLKSANFNKIADGAATYIPAVDTDIGIKVAGLMSSTLTELQTVALVLEYVLSSCFVILYLDNQSIINAYMFEASFTVKVKRHFDVFDNVRTDVLASETTFSLFSLLAKIQERYLVAEKTAVSNNACYFVCNLYQFICHAYWEAGSGFDIILDVMVREIKWKTTAEIWHLNLHMLSGFTVAVRKRLYNRSYLGVLCLLCDRVELSDHVFTYSGDFGFCRNILVEAAVLVFEKKKKAALALVKFSRFVVELYYTKIVDMKKVGLVENDSVISDLSYCLVSMLSVEVVYMLRVVEFFAVRFGRCKLCHFFSGLGGNIFVSIDV
ncbi:hypothetical protein G9A89_001907 [Geosiphon pyriformis]|nr:hypothetical protein G9A89_001907 [Geosiphon pyriformis]